MAIPTLPWGLYRVMARSSSYARRERQRRNQQITEQIRTQKEPEYLDYLAYAIRNNQQLNSFFKKLEDKMQDIRTCEGTEIRQKAKRLAELADKYEEYAKTIENELSKNKIVLGDYTTISYNLDSFNPRFIYCALNKQQRGLKLNHFSYSRKFNGVALTKKDIEESKNKSLEVEISKISQIIDKNKVEKNKLSKKLKRLERKRIIPFFQPDKTGAKKIQLSERIAKLRRIIEIAKIKKEKYEALLKLTPKQKELINKYMDIYLVIIKLCKEIEYLARDFKLHIPRMNEELITSALDILTKEGMTKEELEYVGHELDKIKTDRKNYPHYEMASSNLKAMANAFVKSIKSKN